ncbi:hypothetical protein FOA52_011406 [Chlamydomonas sp. UWO 241]|nr:hypothetical protein FOA52_011406 [Chlamydomonas sp. UWO 241]
MVVSNGAASLMMPWYIIHIFSIMVRGIQHVCGGSTPFVFFSMAGTCAIVVVCGSGLWGIGAADIAVWCATCLRSKTKTWQAVVFAGANESLITILEEAAARGAVVVHMWRVK